MTFLEGTDVGGNPRSNNNIVWKNVTVTKPFSGLILQAVTWLRNILLSNVVPTRVNLRIPLTERTNGLFNFGPLFLDLGPALYPRWVWNGAAGQGVELVGSNTVRVLRPDAFLDNLPLSPGEAQPVNLQVRLPKNYAPPLGQVFHVDLEQLGQPGNPPQFIGGQRTPVPISVHCALARSLCTDGRGHGQPG